MVPGSLPHCYGLKRGSPRQLVGGLQDPPHGRLRRLGCRCLTGRVRSRLVDQACVASNGGPPHRTHALQFPYLDHDLDSAVGFEALRCPTNPMWQRSSDPGGGGRRWTTNETEKPLCRIKDVVEQGTEVSLEGCVWIRPGPDPDTFAVNFFSGADSYLVDLERGECSLPGRLRERHGAL